MTAFGLDPADRTLSAYLRAHAENSPDARFVIDNEGTLSWAGAVEMTLGMCNAFSRLGISRGDHVAIMLDNRREFLASWFGVVSIGGVEVPINPALMGDQLAHVLNHSHCQVAIVQDTCLVQLDAIAHRLKFLRTVVVVGEGKAAHHASVPWCELEYDPMRGRFSPQSFSDPCAIMYTSGSTGPPKGVLISHSQHWTNGSQPTQLFDIGTDDTIYCCLPLHHNMAQGYGVWAAIASGAAIRIGERFKAETFWSDVRAHDATILSFVGAMLVLIAKQPESAEDISNPLRLGFGVPIPKDLHQTFERRFQMELVSAYGSTEATIVAWNHGLNRKVGAAGLPLPGYEVEVVDDNDFAQPPNTLGEIVVRPRRPHSMFSGYWADPERTVRAWRNLWYHTGDRGRIDQDGVLWFSDRMDDVVRRMGEFISSTDVEQALMSHPSVQMAAAFGVPSELAEEELMVAVVPQSGAAPPTAGELREWCSERLPRFAIPRFVEIVAELPLTATGKVEKFKLKKQGVTSTTDDAREIKVAE